MQINWHYVEIALAVTVVVAVFYMIIRHNRYASDDDIMPEIGDVDALMDSEEKPVTKKVNTNPIQEDIGPVRVLSEEESRKKLEEIELQNNVTYSSNISSFKPVLRKQKQQNNDVKNTFIAMHVMAKPGMQFSGYDLYQSLTSAGLTYGEMKIFHRYAERTEKTQKVLFSVASAVNPGHVDLDNIGAFSTIGLTLFMDFAKQKTASASFQMMLNTAKLLAEDLDGVILDNSRQTWCLQAENECRRRIQHYNMQMGRLVSG